MRVFPRLPAWRDAIAALFGYALVALACTWPLPLSLGTRLTGSVTGDAGVYVWNIWLFRHEIVANHHFPFFTNEILSLTPPVDLSLHNYTTFANVVAFPLIPIFGVTATFNLIYLAFIALTGWTMFLLARRVSGRALESWVAGLLFTASPVLIARGTAHFSLVAALPLPVFALSVICLAESGRLRYAVAAGATIAWAALCDAYFGVFCLMFGAVYLGARALRVRATEIRWHRPAAIKALDAVALLLAGLVLGIAVTGGMSVRLGPRSIAMRTVYNPMLALTLTLIARMVIAARPRVSLRERPRAARVALLAATALLACVVPLSPVLYALTYRFADGGTFHGKIFWRSGPGGVDLLSLFAPNPNHAWFGGPWRDWLASVPGGFAENVATLPYVALAVILFAAWRYGFRAPREWAMVTAAFLALSLGPFIHIAGFNTYVPGPWAVLRYVPIVGAVRTPARFAIVTMMGLSVVFAMALAHLGERHARRRRPIVAGVAALLIVELVPAPRTLHPADVPDIYRIIAADPRPVRVLELPFGIRDGESSLGDFAAASQFYQTVHEKRIIGGYLSRISQREKGRQRRFLVLRSLLRRSEGRPMPLHRPDVHRARGRLFVKRARLGYVVIDRSRATPDLYDYAMIAFDLELIATSGDLELYRPRP